MSNERGGKGGRTDCNHWSQESLKTGNVEELMHMHLLIESVLIASE